MMAIVTGNINPADCATLEFPVSPALIFITWCGLLVVTPMNQNKKSNAIFISQTVLQLRGFISQYIVL